MIFTRTSGQFHLGWRQSSWKAPQVAGAGRPFTAQESSSFYTMSPTCAMCEVKSVISSFCTTTKVRFSDVCQDGSSSCINSSTHDWTVNLTRIILCSSYCFVTMIYKSCLTQEKLHHSQQACLDQETRSLGKSCGQVVC